MITEIPFQTRARTIDHLGREQIADCPTAISELWKNSYDAYAKNVSLHIFNDEIPVAAILDDGHGMSKDEFQSKWLVVGTDSKLKNDYIPESDKNGLSERPRQGQKGIGRLSSGAIGSFLLLVSKRNNQKFIAALIDWRIFENPYLMLGDIKLPLVEFDKNNELIELLPQMFDSIMGNIWPSSNDKFRDERVKLAWDMFDNLEKEQGLRTTTSKEIASTIIETVFSEKHLKNWSVWNGDTPNGTALFVSNINFELLALLDSNITSTDDLNLSVKDRFFKTLSGFYDPFYDRDKFKADSFDYKVVTWDNDRCSDFLSKETQFDLKDLHNLEHYIDGSFDGRGIFRGTVKAFGENLGEIEIPPSQIQTVKSRRDMVGPFNLVIGTYEGEINSSTHTPEEHASILEQSATYSGLGVYRDNLRVLPYGRHDNDFFEIEYRRSTSAGRHFWSNRRLFGRVAITRGNNPNLKDKAGREGIIDNRARNAFKLIVEGLLTKVAERYFGRKSELRNEKIPLIQRLNKQKTEEAAKELKRNNRSLFRRTLQGNKDCLNQNYEKAKNISHDIDEAINILDSDNLVILHSKLEDLKQEKTQLRLPPRPKNLGVLEENYFKYKRNFEEFSKLLDNKFSEIKEALEKVQPRSPEEVAKSSLRRHAKYLHDQLRIWKKSIVGLLDSERKKFEESILQDNKVFDLQTLPLIDDLANGRSTLACVLEEFDETHDKLYLQFSEYYDPYIRSLNQLAKGIDIDSATQWNSDKVDELETDMEDYTGLAQLGITVELVAHELERLDYTIGNQLRDLPRSVQESKPFQIAFDAHTELMERLRFLSPLKLSGRSKSRDKITGESLASYILDFFGKAFEENKIEFIVSDNFKKINFEEYRSRIYPVFLNLINNSRYWVSQQNKERKIQLDVIDDKIVISDNGPGIDEEDLDRVFQIFFTRRLRGRGVGLYLCKANLARGRHQIEYATEDRFKLLSGANFVIDIKGLCNE